MSAAVTLIQSTSPTRLCKRYDLVDGKLVKTAIASVTSGVCRSVAVGSAEAMVAVLTKVTASTNVCIVPGVWQGAEQAPFDLVTEGELTTLLGAEGQIPGGVHTIGTRRVAARLKRGISPSHWMLIDADSPVGIPDEWAAMTLAERLAFMEPVIPGISTCERIELRASSARVVRNGGDPGPATHAWLRVNHPELIEVLKAHITVEMVNLGLSFASSRFSRINPGEIVGNEQRTVIDLSVLTTGRIVFNAQPELGAGMVDFTVIDPGIVLVNSGAGVLDISKVKLPEQPALKKYRERTGVKLEMRTKDGAPTITDTGQLTLDTEITVKGTTKTLRDWIPEITATGKLRCEAPFRASQSEAAMIGLHKDGTPFIHDVGCNTTYRLADEVDQTPTMDRAEAIKRARASLAPSIKGRQVLKYPLEALGPLAAACEAISTAGQVRPAMVGQCLLGAASLLTQGLFNVETLAGQKPLSLYLLTLGDSGDGKSTAQSAALQPITEWQRRQSKTFREEQADYARATACRTKGDPLPEEPTCTYRLVGDATVEGLRRDLDSDVCSQGLFSDEAAAILSGYGMSADHRSKTAGVFSKLWDAGHLSVSRVTGGRVERYGRRVATHWLIQPMAAAETVGDPMLASLGFWPRFLAAWPEAQAPRIALPFKPHELPAVMRYWERCNELLEIDLPDDADQAPVLSLSDGARSLRDAAFEGFDYEARRGDFQVIKPFGLRATEQACRIAGVLAAFAEEREVSRETMANALALAAYSTQTWVELIDGGTIDQGGAHALRLYEWLTTRPDWTELTAVIVRAGPACARSKDKRDELLAVLEAAGLVHVADGKARALEPVES